MSDSKTIGEQILEKIKALEENIKLLMLEKKLSDLESRINSISSGITPKEQSKEPVRSRDDFLGLLEETATCTKDANGKRTFLLHRATPDFEFEKYQKEGNIYETSKETGWIVEIEAATAQQINKNPVISCLIPESSIKEVKGAQENTGTWDKLGTNPHTTKFEIIVAPGKFTIHQEIKE